MNGLLPSMAAEIARIRGEVHGCVGDRPYHVAVVVVGWSGGEPGRGERRELQRTPIGCGLDCEGRVVPPVVRLEGAWARSMHGLVEQGRAVLEEVDPTLTEQQLVGYGQQAEGEESWVEVTQGDGVVRRYVVDGPPVLLTNPFGWVVRLRSHEPQGVWPPAQGGL